GKVDVIETEQPAQDEMPVEGSQGADQRGAGARIAVEAGIEAARAHRGAEPRLVALTCEPASCSACDAAGRHLRRAARGGSSRSPGSCPGTTPPSPRPRRP